MTNCSDTILEVLFKGCYRFTMTVAHKENFILISENCFLVRKIWKIPAGWMALLVANWNNFVRACLYTDNLICFLYYKRMFFVLFLCFCKFLASYFSWPKNTTLTQTRVLVRQKNSKKSVRHMRYIDTSMAKLLTMYLILFMPCWTQCNRLK